MDGSRGREALANVVISATPLDRAVPAGGTAPATILQQDFDFVPAVTAIRAGTRVTFPNRDKREHHLKSSGVQAIEFRIYDAKSTPAPMVFDKTGTTVLFCYLHDWMKAYIHVVDTPYFAKTERTGEQTFVERVLIRCTARPWRA